MKLHANKWDNLQDMDKFLETYNLPKLNQKERHNLNRPITRIEIESVIQKLPKHKSPGPEVFIGELYQAYKENIIPLLLKLLQKNWKGNTPKFILWGHYYRDTKTKQRHYQKRKLEANISDEYSSKNLHKILANQIQQYTKRIIHHDHVGFIPGTQG